MLQTLITKLVRLRYLFFNLIQVGFESQQRSQLLVLNGINLTKCCIL